MRKSFGNFFKAVFIYWLWGASAGQATVNVTFSTAVPANFQQEFIANTTGQYLSTLVPNPYFSNTYALMIRGKNPTYVPPVVSSPVYTATAVDQLISYGFGNGMDTERFQDVGLIWGVQASEAMHGTCGGEFVGFDPNAVFISTTTAFLQCLNAYNVMVSTIQERWGYLYDPNGNKVAP